MVILAHPMDDSKNSPALPPAMFIGGHLGLDFLNSIAVPAEEIVEWIGDGRGYLSWLEQAGLLTTAEVSGIESRMPARELNAVAAEARALREWFRSFVLANQGRPLKPSVMVQLGPLVRILERDELFLSIQVAKKKDAPPPDQHGSGANSCFTIRPARHWRTPKSLLLPVAEVFARLVCSPDFKWIKACEGPKCTLLFLDLTRRRARRWCSMSVCGNRAKQAAHRKKVRKEEG
jgi:predicted RNA-binding Zn ribbon-like protein